MNGVCKNETRQKRDNNKVATIKLIKTGLIVFNILQYIHTCIKSFVKRFDI